MTLDEMKRQELEFMLDPGEWAKTFSWLLAVGMPVALLTWGFEFVIFGEPVGLLFIVANAGLVFLLLLWAILSLVKYILLLIHIILGIGD